MCEPVGMSQTVCALPPADEKSQIQALDRTQPDLPLKPGKCGTMTHDYKRNGMDLPGICGERFRFYAARPSN